LKNITFVSTRVTESTPKSLTENQEENELTDCERVHKPAVLGTESECLECALYEYESIREIEELKPIVNQLDDFLEDVRL
jgi:hypothetical protein